MIKVLDTDCYTTNEIVKEIGSGYNLKRIEYLRNIGLLPRPVKIGTGINGTVGCYPPDVIPFLRTVETKRKNGKTYRAILVDMKDVVFSLQVKVGRLRQIRFQQNHVSVNLSTGELTEVSFKPTGEERKKIDPKEVREELNGVEKELRRLFRSKDCLSPKVLATIKSKIKQVQDLRITRKIIDNATPLIANSRKEGVEKALKEYQERHED